MFMVSIVEMIPDRNLITALIFQPYQFSRIINLNQDWLSEGERAFSICHLYRLVQNKHEDNSTMREL